MCMYWSWMYAQGFALCKEVSRSTQRTESSHGTPGHTSPDPIPGPAYMWILWHPRRFLPSDLPAINGCHRLRKATNGCGERLRAAANSCE